MPFPFPRSLAAPEPRYRARTLSSVSIIVSMLVFCVSWSARFSRDAVFQSLRLFIKGVNFKLDEFARPLGSMYFSRSEPFSPVGRLLNSPIIVCHRDPRRVQAFPRDLFEVRKRRMQIPTPLARHLSIYEGGDVQFDPSPPHPRMGLTFSSAFPFASFSAQCADFAAPQLPAPPDRTLEGLLKTQHWRALFLCNSRAAV